MIDSEVKQLAGVQGPVSVISRPQSAPKRVWLRC